MATRQAGELIGVHVVPSDGLAGRAGPELEAQRLLLAQLGGVYREVVGEDVSKALAGFARAEKATQLVLGESRRSRASELLHGSVVNKVLRYSRGLDVHVISTTEDDEEDEQELRDERGGPRFAWARRAAPLPLHRRVAGLVVAAVGLPLLTAVLTPFRDSLSLTTALLLFLALTVVVAALGGVVVGAAGGGRRIAAGELVPRAPLWNAHHQRS